jgi:glycerophosphoryl diester phosphodiesterase
VRLGYPGVEFDVRRSRDGVPVVVHDEQVPPRGGGRRRPVADLDAREIDAPSLEETLALAWGSTVLMGR